MMRFLLGCFVFLCLAARPVPGFTAGDSVHITIDFPVSDIEDNRFAPPSYEKGVVGTDTFLVESRFSLKGKVQVQNLGPRPLGPLRLELEAGPHLGFVSNHQEPFVASKKIWDLGGLKPGQSSDFLFKVKRPSFKELSSNRTASFLRARVVEEGPPAGIYALHFPVTIRKSMPGLGPGVLIGLSLALFIALIAAVRRLRLFKRFQTTELVTLSVFVAFYVLGSFLSSFVKSIGISSLLMHFLWSIYSWVLLITLLRFVPKPGSVGILMILGALVTGILVFGVDALMLLTYTIPGALALELWFALSGYGRSLVSVLGSAVVHVLFPITFFWFITAPVIYHTYYSFWYVLFWLAINAVAYITGALLAYRAAGYFERVIH